MTTALTYGDQCKVVFFGLLGTEIQLRNMVGEGERGCKFPLPAYASPVGIICNKLCKDDFALDSWLML
jgi:hypothetical protein